MTEMLFFLLYYLYIESCNKDPDKDKNLLTVSNYKTEAQVTVWVMTLLNLNRSIFTKPCLTGSA